jgi:UDP-N-acetylglucosamine--N-acetylmuramyl-(pentapeptide) pyrophosphoryl-undecaprenol N-acetylglucosamine transferase
MTVRSRPTIVATGGGTGGHVFPMLAVADALRDIGEVRVVFFGTERGLEARVAPERGYELETMDLLPMRGGGALTAARGALRAATSVRKARALLRKHEARAVFSVGGYVAGATSLAARTLGLPLGLLEPNCEIGLANRLIAPFVQRAYIAFEESARHFPKRATRLTGVPIRQGFSPRSYARTDEQLRVLVLGGSQGAKALNEVVPQALARAKTRVSVVHQAGKDRDGEVRERYVALGAGDRAEVVPFIQDMPAALADADLVIGRSGASAVSELCAVGRPSLLIPYPHAGDHQRHNAEALSHAGAAVMVLAEHATVERIAQEIDRMSSEPSQLTQMADRARERGRPAAAHAIAKDMLELVGITGVEAL